jgi:hypothetical protein
MWATLHPTSSPTFSDWRFFSRSWPRMKASSCIFNEMLLLTLYSGGRYTPFMQGYRPQLFLRTADVTVTLKFAEGTPNPEEKMVSRLELLKFSSLLNTATGYARWQRRTRLRTLLRSCLGSRFSVSIPTYPEDYDTELPSSFTLREANRTSKAIVYISVSNTDSILLSQLELVSSPKSLSNRLPLQWR